MPCCQGYLKRHGVRNRAASLLPPQTDRFGVQSLGLGSGACDAVRPLLPPHPATLVASHRAQSQPRLHLNTPPLTVGSLSMTLSYMFLSAPLHLRRMLRASLPSSLSALAGGARWRTVLPTPDMTSKSMSAMRRFETQGSEFAAMLLCIPAPNSIRTGCPLSHGLADEVASVSTRRKSHRHWADAHRVGTSLGGSRSSANPINA